MIIYAHCKRNAILHSVDEGTTEQKNSIVLLVLGYNICLMTISKLFLSRFNLGRTKEEETIYFNLIFRLEICNTQSICWSSKPATASQQ